MFERFTPRARRAVIAAVQHARSLGHGAIGPEHLLLGVLADPDGVAGRVVAAAGLSYPEAVRRVREGVSESVRRAGLDDADIAALADLGIDVDAVVARVEESFGAGALVPDRTRRGRRGRPRTRVRHVPRTLPFRPEAKRVLEAALVEARDLGHRVLGTEHLLLGILAEGRGPAYDLLLACGLDHATARQAVLARLRRAS
jgi:ATP-dependent Clp protease ATP-binding subunit ClpA